MNRIGIVAGLAMFAMCGRARASNHPAPCPKPLEGLERVFTGPLVVALGEIHGSNEVPRLVGDMACQAAALGVPVIVAYEIDGGEQPRLDAFLESDGGSAARAELLSGDFWRTPYKDGRQSEALLRLLERIRRMRRSGAKIDFAAVVRGKLGEDRDQRMAEGVVELRDQEPGAIILLVAGNNHTRVDVGYAMGARLRARGVSLLSLNVTYRTGTVWACVNQCGLHEAEGTNRGSTPFIQLKPFGGGAFDGMIYLGKISGSPPAVRTGSVAD